MANLRFYPLEEKKPIIQAELNSLSKPNNVPQRLKSAASIRYHMDIIGETFSPDLKTSTALIETAEKIYDNWLQETHPFPVFENNKQEFCLVCTLSVVQLVYPPIDHLPPYVSLLRKYIFISPSFISPTLSTNSGYHALFYLQEA